MNKRTLHELAKFGSGLVAADFLSVWWLSAQGLLPVTWMGLSFTPDMVAPTLIFDAAIFLILVHYGWHIGKVPRFERRTYLLTAGTVFGLVAVAHLLRIFTGADVVVGGWTLPFWLSWVGTAVTAYLSYMSFHLATKKQRK